MSEFHHVSVLLEECIQGLAIKPDGIYVDGTLGGAGHSSRIAADHQYFFRHLVLSSSLRFVDLVVL